MTDKANGKSPQVSVTSLGHSTQACELRSWSLVAVAVLILHVVLQATSPRPRFEWCELSATLLVTCVAYIVFSHRVPRSSLMEICFLCIFSVAPFAADVFTRRAFGHGHAFEIQIMLALRNQMLGLLMLRRRESYQQLAVLASLYVVIYGALLAVTVFTQILLGLYALCGAWWLMGNHWKRIQGHFPEESQREIPYLARFGGVFLVLVAVAGAVWGVPCHVTTTVLAGFMPTSGGVVFSDRYARGGVGDGDQMVGATEEAHSFGPIESQLFLESQQPSLYDMFVRKYEAEAARKNRSQSRAIPLSSQEKPRENDRRFAQSMQAGREFSVVRQATSRRQPAHLDDIPSEVLLHVSGRVPLHLALATFDHWDGKRLLPSGDTSGPRLYLERDSDGRPWATWAQPPRNACFGEMERHVVKVINLSTATIPTPANMTAIHLDKLHDARFFVWADGLLQVRADRIPSLSVVHVKSHPLREERLAQLMLRCDESCGEPAEDRVAALSAAWTAGATTDWERVERICAKLRTFSHDPETTVPWDADDAVEYFLFESQAGPDYLFATAAAVLLRSLGYETRVTSGLYADPSNYDRVAQTTSVYLENVHFWVEVMAREGGWVAVEPTPGYELLYARPTVAERFAAWWVVCRGYLGRHPLWVAFFLLVVVCAGLGRKTLLVWGTMWRWQLFPGVSPRPQVLRAVAVLQRLAARRSRSRRKSGQTVDHWLMTLEAGCGDTRTIGQFRRLAAWAAYASDEQPVIPAEDVRRTCIESVKILKASL